MLRVQSAVATVADAHTDSGGLHITAHLLHTVQDTSGQWCVGRVMERETLSNNTEYQERLREGRIIGALQGREREDRLKLLKLDQERLREGRIIGALQGREREDRLKLLKLDQERRQLQQQVSVVRSRYSQYCQLCSE